MALAKGSRSSQIKATKWPLFASDLEKEIFDIFVYSNFFFVINGFIYMVKWQIDFLFMV